MPTNLRTVTCKGCGRPIVFAVNMKGDTIPLDPRAPVYRVWQVQGGGTMCTQLGDDPEGETMVSHFATCPKASEFSRGGRRT